MDNGCRVKVMAIAHIALWCAKNEIHISKLSTLEGMW